jgi:TRAP-type C4-dicarboxylate transport system permease small subunit
VLPRAQSSEAAAPLPVTAFGRVALAVDHVVGALCWAGAGLSAAAILACLGLITYAVTMRYVFNAPPAWVDETVGYLLVASVMGAIAHALRQGEHICVDIITERLPARARDVVATLGLVAVALLAAIMLFEAYETVSFSALIGLRSNGQLATPMQWPQSMMLIGFGLLLLAALSGLLRRAAGLPPLAPPTAHAAPVANPLRD